MNEEKNVFLQTIYEIVNYIYQHNWMTARLVWAKQNICTNALYFKKKKNEL